MAGTNTPDIWQHPLWNGVDPEVVRRTIAAGVLRVLPAGAALAVQGDPEPKLQVIVRGSVRTSSGTSEGEELMLSLAHAPALLGEAECLLGTPARAHAVALERCALLELDRAAVQAALAACPRFAANLARALADKLRGAEARQVALAFEPVDTRLARLLLEYAGAYGLPVHGGTKIRVPLCQDELARALGVARRSITRALKTWTEGGVLAKEARCYVIRDLAPLRAACPTDDAAWRMEKPAARA